MLLKSTGVPSECLYMVLKHVTFKCIVNICQYILYLLFFPKGIERREWDLQSRIQRGVTYISI